jgi:hypothetical protein
MRKSTAKILKKMSGGHREIYRELKRLHRIKAIKAIKLKKNVSEVKCSS